MATDVILPCEIDNRATLFEYNEILWSAVDFRYSPPSPDKSHIFPRVITENPLVCNPLAKVEVDPAPPM